MKTIYHKPVTELLRDFVKESVIKKGENHLAQNHRRLVSETLSQSKKA